MRPARRRKSRGQDLSRSSRQGLSLRGAANLGVSLLAVVMVAVFINARTTGDDATDDATDDASPITTSPQESPLTTYERTLRMEVAAYVGYGQHVESLIRRPVGERSDSATIASDATPFVAIIDNTNAIVKRLVAPTAARQARSYVLQSGEVLRASVSALRDTSVDPLVRVAMAARLKLLADRIFDRVRVSLDRAAQPNAEDVAARLRVQPVAPAYDADSIAPQFDGIAMQMPAVEVEVEESAWRSAVSTQAAVMTKALGAPVPDPLTMAEVADRLALRLPDEGLTEAGRVIRLATLVGLESAVARRQGSIALADTLGKESRDLWRAGAEGADVPTIDPEATGRKLSCSPCS